MNVMKESFKYTKRYLGAWLTVAGLGIITVFALLLLPQVPQLLIDRIINPALGAEPKVNDNNVFTSLINLFSPTDYWGMFACLLVIFAVLLGIRYIGHYIRWNVSHRYGVKAEQGMRVAVFNKMLDQNSLVMARYTSGDLMSICNSDPVVIKDVWSLNLSVLIDQFVVIFIAAYFLSRINPLFIILPLFLGIMSIVLMYFYIKKLRQHYNEIRTASIDLNSCVQENINGVRIVRAFASEEVEVNKFTKKNNKFTKNFISQSKTQGIFNIWFNGLGQAVNFGSIIIGVVLASKGTISLGEFTTFAAYVGMINGPLIAVANHLGIVQNAMICGNRMFTFLNTSNFISDPENPKEIPQEPNLSMQNVSIKLDENEELIDVSVDIPFGKKLGIMGETGAGKSVMLKALARFFETTKGQTMLDGENIKNYKVEEVRRLFGYVMQEVFLFSNTIDANIALYDETIPHEEVEKAAVIAEAHDFIVKMEDGYDTVVGERGLGLSGGQKQRISIARALVKDSPILMFDDATSALDLETERKILTKIKEKYDHKTLIIASHRCASVEHCDEIIYLEKGRIIERGSHEELMKAKGKYFTVYSSQEASRQGVIA